MLDDENRMHVHTCHMYSVGRLVILARTPQRMMYVSGTTKTLQQPLCNTGSPRTNIVLCCRAYGSPVI